MAFAAVVLAAWWLRGRPQSAVGVASRVAASPLPAMRDPLAPVAVTVVPSPAVAEGRLAPTAPALARFVYAQNWDAPPGPAFAAFRAWTDRYRAAAGAASTVLVAEGVTLARERRGEMRSLMERDPGAAFGATVPAAVRAVLPAAVLAELE
jgi:hypothetical protein